jgi:hypothetical protein
MSWSDGDGKALDERCRDRFTTLIADNLDSHRH